MSLPQRGDIVVYKNWRGYHEPAVIDHIPYAKGTAWIVTDLREGSYEGYIHPCGLWRAVLSFAGFVATEPVEGA